MIQKHGAKAALLVIGALLAYIAQQVAQTDPGLAKDWRAWAGSLLAGALWVGWEAFRKYWAQRK